MQKSQKKVEEGRGEGKEGEQANKPGCTSYSRASHAFKQCPNSDSGCGVIFANYYTCSNGSKPQTAGKRVDKGTHFKAALTSLHFTATLDSRDSIAFAIGVTMVTYCKRPSSNLMRCCLLTKSCFNVLS